MTRPEESMSASRASPKGPRTRIETVVAPDRLAQVFVEVADTLVDDFDLIEFLQMVTTHTSELANANTAVLLLAHQGRLQLMASHGERADMLELVQLLAEEGPGSDCFRQAIPVINVDLRQTTDLWPRFTPRAVAAGFQSVHAFPLRLRRTVIGTLILLHTRSGQIAGADAGRVQALADVATIGLLQERAIREGGVLSEQLQAALITRTVIEQAKGVLGHIHGDSPEEAFQRLRGYCRTRHLRIRDVAFAVVNEPTSVEELTGP